MDALMDLTVSQIVARIAGFIAIASVFIEITPIKINPISHILRWMGRQTNKDVMDRLNDLEDKVGELEKSDAISCRVRILRFSDEIRRNLRHSKETFDQALSDVDTYELYCASHPTFLNSKTVAAKQKIIETYSKCLDENDFL